MIHGHQDPDAHGHQNLDAQGHQDPDLIPIIYMCYRDCLYVYDMHHAVYIFRYSLSLSIYIYIFIYIYNIYEDSIRLYEIHVSLNGFDNFV